MILAGSCTEAASSSTEVVNLPAFVVDGADGKATKPPHWFYAELPGVRVLSCCSLETTESMVAEIRDQTRLYHWMIPSGITPELGQPLVAILDDRPSTSLRLLLNSKQSLIRSAGASRAVVIGAAIVDWDFAVVFRQVNRVSPTMAASAVLADASNAILVQQPGWAHLERVISRARLNVTAVGTGVDIYQPPNTLTERRLPLPSVSALFSPEGTPAEVGTASLDETARWFGRWALFADDGDHREALWKFAKATASRPRLDDETAQYYFGLTLSAMDVYVARFRSRSQSTANLHLRLPAVPATPLAEVRDATEEEIACAVVPWCLLASRSSPELSGPLRDAARRAIERARAAGEPTLPVVAMAGLIEVSAGNTADARTLLELTADAPKLTARARLELARLRFDEAASHTALMGRKFDAAQTASIMAPLRPFLQQPPGGAEPYDLIVETWLKSGERPPRADLIRLAAMVRLFPWNTELLQRTAELCSQYSLEHEASELTAIASAAAESDEARAKLKELGGRAEAKAGK